MTMENWSKEVRTEVSNISISIHLTTSILQLRRCGGSVDGRLMTLVSRLNMHGTTLSKSSSATPGAFEASKWSAFLNNNYRWNQHLSNFEELHGEPPPSIAAYFLVPEGYERLKDQLHAHCKAIFTQIPGWHERVILHPVESIDTSTRVRAEADIGRVHRER